MTATNPTPTASAGSGFAPPPKSSSRRAAKAAASTTQTPNPVATTPLYVMGALIAAGAIAALSSGVAGTGGSLRAGLLMLTLSGATALVGGFVGFLFGLPRFDYAAREAAAAQASPATASGGAGAAAAAAAIQSSTGKAPVRYRPNANLDEIADWLTKIIVGLGLTQLLNVGPALRNVAAYIVTGCGVGCPSQPLVASVIVFGAVSGLLFGYLWTRLRYVKLAAATDVDTTETLKQIDAGAALEYGVGGKKKASSGASLGEAIKATSTPSDDPNKGRFGGSSVANGRALRAIIEPSELRAGWYRVTLIVSATDVHKPLRGKVTFHLHPTFHPDVVERDVVNGVATLVIVAYGAFTVGAVADDGQTGLELDLEENPDATADFRSR